jgi:hypothetical protein
MLLLMPITLDLRFGRWQITLKVRPARSAVRPLFPLVDGTKISYMSDCRADMGLAVLLATEFAGCARVRT